MNHDVIVALDFPSAQDVYAFLDRFNYQHASHGEGALLGEQSGLMPRHKSAGFAPHEKPFVKIGMELFYAEGPEIVRQIKQRGHKIFLDLKLHDIPNTVKSAMRVLSRLDIDMVNVHAAGTMEMMRAGLEGLTREDGTRPLLLAVTQLTSTGEERMRKELLISASMPETVAHYARNAKEAGLDGVVCSPLEAALVKSACGPDFFTVTPGIRFSDSAADDQTRVMTPEKARLSGSDFIVVGRPITRAADPAAAYRRCMQEFLECPYHPPI